MIKKFLFGVLALIALGTVVFFAGPRPHFETFDNQPLSLSLSPEDVDPYVVKLETREGPIKPDNEARVIWADSSRQKTPYSIVYLHGFSASQGEGYPIHLNLAKRLHANLYLSRLEDHGKEDPDTFKDIEPSEWVADAKEAIAIGKAIGDSVIVMSCSTGGTLAIYLAAGDPEIDGLVLLSPNIDIYTQTTDMLTGPWGEWIAHQTVGEYRKSGGRGDTQRYWSTSYHVDGLIALQGLLDATMTPAIFSQINIPVYCGYYYKNEDEQDFVVSVDAMLDFGKSISTPEAQKVFQAFPEAGNHVIGSVYKTDHYTQVESGIAAFLESVMGLELSPASVN